MMNRIPKNCFARTSAKFHNFCAKKMALSQAKLVGAATRTQGDLPKRACLRGQSIPVKLLADSEWTRRDSNPNDRQAKRLVRFDTHRTPSLFQIGGFNLFDLAIVQSEINWQVVVPPILLLSVICLGISPVTPTTVNRCGLTATGLLHCCSSPPALLPIRHSPSRRHCFRRWWAFTPPFRP